MYKCKRYFILLALLVLIFSAASVSAVDLDDGDVIQQDDSQSVEIVTDDSGDEGILEKNEILESSDDSLVKSESNVTQLSSDAEVSTLTEESEEIVVDDWNQLQYYCSLKDKDYVLRLKENTNFYPDDPSDSSYQIIVNNNVKIIGSEGSYIGDSSQNFRNIVYTAIKCPDDSGIGLTIENVTFKWIGVRYQPDGVFLWMGGNTYNSIRNCYFTEIETTLGHSCIVYIKRGDALVENCTFINCTTDFGCISIYDPSDDTSGLCTGARMNVTDCYFEDNYAKTEPGCINNCGLLIVRNSTFYKNSAFWWAGAIHTHGGANTTIYDSNFTDNLAGWNGGALYTYSYLQIYNTTFKGNNCTTNNGGGAIGACKYLHAPYIYITDCLFEDNENLCWGLSELSTTGTGRGGAISLMDEGGLEVYNSTFIRNSASIGSAICAISQGTYGSPYVIIVGNKFYNHTRIDDVLNVRVEKGSLLLIEDNYYYNNSIPFSKLRLVADDAVNGEVKLTIQASLENPSYYDSDILETSEYDVYVDGEFVKRINGTTFSLNIENGKISSVYVVPCISNSVSNTILIGKSKEYIYVSQKSGNDDNDGLTRQTPVLTLSKAIELARNYENILIMDGTFSESNLTIDYELNIVGENGATISGTNNIFIVNSPLFSLNNLTIKNAQRSTPGQASSNGEIFLQALNTTGFLIIDNCKFISNNYRNIILAKNIAEIKNSEFTKNTGQIISVISLDMDNCSFTENTVSTSYSIIDGSKVKDWTISNTVFKDNSGMGRGVIAYSALGSTQKLSIINSSFIHNSVYSTSRTVYSSCLYLGSASNLLIDSSVFMENVDRTENGNMIYYYAKTASTEIKNSIFLNNTCENKYGIVFGGYNSITNNVVCNDNWFGNTIDNLTRPVFYYPVTCTEWLVLNISANCTSLGIGEKALITLDINNVVDKNGVVSKYNTTNFPKFPITFKSTNGILSSSDANLVNGKAQTTFELKGIGQASVSGKLLDREVSVKLSGVKITPNLGIDVENVTYGEDAVIYLFWPNDISTVDLSYQGSHKIPFYDLFIKINGKSYDLDDVITLPDLAAGKYQIELTYTGNSKYLPVTLNKTFEVYKKTPQLTIDVNNSYVGSDVDVVVSIDPKLTGNIVIKLGDKIQSKDIVDGKAVFKLSDLDANDYVLIANYSGNTNYSYVQNSSNFSVKKYETVTNIDYDLISDDNKVILDIDVTPAVSGNGKIIIKHNDEISEVDISFTNGKLTYTIDDLKKGEYNITVVFDGDNRYSSSQDSFEFAIAKVSPTIEVSIEDIDYGQDAVVIVNLNDDATGNVFVIVDGKNITGTLDQGKAEIKVSDLAAGNKKATIIYDGDYGYLNSSATASFKVSKITPTLQIDVDSVKVGNDVNIQIRVPRGVSGTITVNCDSRKKLLTINSRMGLVSWKLSDLAVGNYTITAEYNGDSNYLRTENSEKFEVSDWDVPQWPNEGFDGNEKSPYESSVNGEVIWFSQVDGTIVGNMIIDSDGNIYVTTSKGIYSLDSDGNKRWVFTSRGVESNFPGISIGHDVVIAPNVGDTLYFINQKDGTKFGYSNIYQGSSLYAPVIDSNANVYIASEYQYSSSSYNLVVIPYSIWENGGTPTLISLGKSKPVASPVIVNDNLIVVACDDGLKLIDLSTSSTISSMSGKIDSGRPVVGQGDIIYAIIDDSIAAFDSEFTQIWKTKVTGGAGKYLAIDNEQGVYSINAKGNMYKYDLITGDESLLSNITFTSGFLIGADGNLYAGSDNSFYALDSQGNELWKVNIENSIVGSPVMDKNGIIYLTSENKVYALTNAPLKNADLTVDVEDIDQGETQQITITLNDETTGKISIKVTGENYSKEFVENIIDGSVVISIPDLNRGSYSVDVIYSGDEKFAGDENKVSFNVNSEKININSSANNVSVGEVVNIKVTLPNDASGIVTVYIGDNKYNATINEGLAEIIVSDLEKGNYTYVVSYYGDSKYSNATVKGSFSVNPLDSIINIISGEIYYYGSDASIVVKLNDDATGTVKLSIGDKNMSADLVNGEAVFTIPSLELGEIEFYVTYVGDKKHAFNSTKGTLRVVKNKETNIIVSPLTVDKLADKYSATLVDYAGNGIAGVLLTLNVNNISIDAITDNNGKATFDLSLKAGLYPVEVNFKGNDDYNAGTADSSIKVIGISSISVVTIYGDCRITAVLKDANGNPIPNARIVYTLDNGAKMNINSDDKGEFTITARNNCIISMSFEGDELNKASSHSISVKNLSPVKKDTKIFVDKTFTRTAVDFPAGEKGYMFYFTLKDTSGKALANKEVKIGVSGKIYTVKTDKNGKSGLMINLANANVYTYAISFLGDSEYKSSFEVSKLTVVKKAVTITPAKTSYSFKANAKSKVITATLKSSNKFIPSGKKVTLVIGGKTYSAVVAKNGKISLNIAKFVKKGTYKVTIKYAGDATYKAAVSKTITVKLT